MAICASATAIGGLWAKYPTMSSFPNLRHFPKTAEMGYDSSVEESVVISALLPTGQQTKPPGQI
ncbi:hypothetical protein EYF80_001391 [Liparis tanakae]|uniref:Uncharacterized protein n=1 Tax=Liparis tanakae TaxID=230148 RepID=A0A4Z2JCZ7_9TELE|nr:hypothetical protein EYF80_001391 [Liparis tanakae]